MRGVLSLLLIALWMPTLFGATGTLMPTPYQTVLDTSGNPVSGGCVWTFSAGTTTPATTYSDSALTTPNTNPIVADSAGRFVAWLSAGTSYKFTYETACTAPAHGSVLRTVDNVLAVPGSSNPTTDISTVNARCTLSSGTPVTTSDVTAATSVYIEPYHGNRIALYDGASWNLRTVTATSFAVPATTNTVYDVFAYDSSSTPTYETLAWTNDTTRATALTTQDGVLSKSGSLTRRYLCSFRTTGASGQTEDSAAKRYLANYYNRVPRKLRRAETGTTWTYTTATWRQANANTANQVEVVVGWDEAPLSLDIVGLMGNSTGNVNAGVAVGIDTTTVPDADMIGGAGQANTSGVSLLVLFTGHLVKHVGVGRHYAAWLEYSSAAGTSNWYGTGNFVASTVQAGLSGTILQ
jgi:hypothetical protein